MKYIDADLLIRKIKGQIRLESLNFAALGGGEQAICIRILTWVLKQIDSLQQEQPEVDLEKYISVKLRVLGADLINHKPYSFNRGLNVGKTSAYNDILKKINARKEDTK